GGGRGRDGGARHHPRRADRRAPAHRPHLDRGRGAPGARGAGARGPGDRGGHPAPPGAHRRVGAQLRLEPQDGAAAPDQARRRGLRGGAGGRHHRLRGHRSRAARAGREGGRGRGGRQRHRRGGDRGAAPRPPWLPRPSYAGHPAERGAGSAPGSARRHPRSGRGRRRHDPRLRAALDGESGRLPVTQPQHALRRVTRPPRAVDDAGRRREGELVTRPALLALADGRVFRGEALGATGEAHGEVVFNTSMTGYQEILTDPSYRGQMVCMTYPLIGNYGINPEDVESRRPWLSGFIVKEACPFPSSWRSRVPLDDYLREHRIVGIQSIDTRALTRHLRDRGAQEGIISTEDVDGRGLTERARALRGLVGRDLVTEVSVEAPHGWTEGPWDLARGYTTPAPARFRV